MKNVYGLIGHPLGHSYSPKIHQAIFQMTQRQGSYSLFDITEDQISSFLNGPEQSGLEGFNVTIPYKQVIMPYMDEVDGKALRIGAVNTVQRIDNKLKGFNTDYIGFKELLLEAGCHVSGRNVLILGDGGSARTVYTCLCDSNVSTCYMASRKPTNCRLSFPEAWLLSYEDVYGLQDIYLMVNCTPVGMHPNPGFSPLEIDRLPAIPFFIDLIYNPSKTCLMEGVEKKGGLAINGLYMLVSQGVAAQEIWTNSTIPKEVTKKVYRMIQERI